MGRAGRRGARTARRLMLDTNVYDRVVAEEGFTERLARAVGSGRIEILRTPVQDQEIQRIPDAARRAAMQLVPFRRVPISAAAWCASPPPSEDDLIAATAEAEADVLVTEDRELRRQVEAKGGGLEAWSFDRLARFIDALPDP